MKKLVLFLVIVVSVLSLSAQKPSLNKAYNYYYDKDFVKAKEEIELCLQDEKIAGKAQAWLYKANICYFLANEEYSAKQKDESYQIKNPDAPVEAYDAFMKSKEINANAEAMDMFTAKDALKQLYPLLLVRGVDQLIAQDYAGAKSTLEKGIASYEMDKPQYPMNGDLYYYYAYTLEAMGDKSDLNPYLQKAIDDGCTNPYVYVRLLENYKKADDKAAAKTAMEQAKTKLPADISVKMAEIDYYYWLGDSTKAKSLLNGISPANLKTADEIVNLANFYIKESKYEDAVEMLEKANALSPNNFVVLYNLGVCYYNISEKQFNQYNQKALVDPNSAEAANFKAESDKSMTKAAEYFEQARQLEPKDANLLSTLKAIYARQQSPKYDEIEKALKELGK